VIFGALISSKQNLLLIPHDRGKRNLYAILSDSFGKSGPYIPSSFYNNRTCKNTVKIKSLFSGMLTCFGCETKTGVVGIWLFSKVGLCSAISFKRSRRELSIDVAEHRSMLKIYQNTHYPRFSFIPKTGICFHCEAVFVNFQYNTSGPIIVV